MLVNEPLVQLSNWPVAVLFKTASGNAGTLSDRTLSRRPWSAASGAIVGANARAHGQTLVNSHEAHAVDELGRGTVTSPHERRLGTYGSEGWGFESLRARHNEMASGQHECSSS